MKLSNPFNRQPKVELPKQEFTLAEIVRTEKNKKIKAWVAIGILSIATISTLNLKRLFGTDTEKFVSMLENQAGGTVLLNDIDPKRNPR